MFLLNITFADSNLYINYLNKPKWNLKKANWQTYHDKMEILTLDIGIDDLSYETLVSNILSACECAIPKFNNRHTSKDFNKSWWTEERNAAVANRKTLMTAYNTHGQPSPAHGSVISPLRSMWLSEPHLPTVGL